MGMAGCIGHGVLLAGAHDAALPGSVGDVAKRLRDVPAKAILSLTLTAELRRQGLGVNHKTVQKLMVEMQLKSLVRPKRYKAFQGAVAEAAPNHLQRDFKAAQPNEKWATDVTEFKVNNRKLYLSPVMDLYNREIVPYDVEQSEVAGHSKYARAHSGGQQV